MRRHLTILCILVLCAACTGPSLLPPRRTSTPSPSPTSAPTPSPTPEPKTLTVCLDDEPDSLYLYSPDSEAAHHVWQALYDGPVDSRDYRQQPVILTKIPRLSDGASVQTRMVQTGDRVLAASGSVMALAPGVTIKDAQGDQTVFQGDPLAMKQMVVTFTLRSDVRWSDGEPLTADDSVYAFELAAHRDTPTDKHIIERTGDYRAVGEYQVLWRSLPGFIDPAYYLNFWHPLPRHAWEHLSAGELLTAKSSTREPLGWGPFSIRQWVSGDSIALERNPFYFRASESLPRLDEVVFRFVPDGDDLARDLLEGRCDVVTHEATRNQDLDPLRASPAAKVISIEDSSWELVAFGISPVASYDRADFFEDARVRQAIAQCTDRQALAKEAYGVGGRVLHSYLPPDHPIYGPTVRPSEELTAWPYDPEAGQLLLAESGWYDETGDAVREAHGVPGIADGTPFQVTYKTTDEPLRLRTATLLMAQLKTCGIEVNLEIQPAETLFAPGPEGDLFGRRFDLAQFSWRITAEPLCDTFLSTQIPGEGDWRRPNVGGFIDSAYDDACRNALEAPPSGPAYADHHAEAQRIFSERLPVLPLFQRQRTTLARAAVKGLAPNPSQRSELWNLEQIDVER